VIPVKPVQVESALTAESFTALLHREMLALRVRGYFDVTPDAVARAVSALEPVEGANRQPVSYGAATPDLLSAPRERYFERARSQAAALGEIFGNQPTPFTLLQRDLARLWGAGVEIARIDGGTMAPGTIRYFRPGDLMNPHVDLKEHLVGDICSFARLAVNLYLAVPPDGGSLELWEVPPTDEQLERWHLADYSLDREQIGSPDLVVHPAAGDLILFHSDQIHAVSEVRSGFRLTASCFLGIRELDHPVRIFA
jgi:2OG-Fe(II) oxygenase superfamily